jgi:5-methylcytosine-specific restriction endonuclease McrA
MKQDLYSDYKTCSICNRTLKVADFYKDKRKNAHGARSECKRCSTERAIKYSNTEQGRKLAEDFRKTANQRERRKAYMNSERGKSLHKKYRQSDKGKAVMARKGNKRRAEISMLSTLTAQEWNDIKKQYKYKCVYCGQVKPLSQDHIVPISKGGNHIKENIVPACKSCNSIKGNRPVLLQLLVEASQ